MSDVPSDVSFHTLVAACRAELPDLVVDETAFVAYVAERCPEGTSHAVDLYLAFACLAGQAAALRELDLRHGMTIDRALRGLDPRALEDAKQLLRARLFAGDAPKIALYSGRGPLGGWLRVVANRLRLELVGPKEVPAEDWAIAALAHGGDDPEVAYLKARYRAEYKHVLADAYAALPDRERTVLAQYHVDRLSIDELGALYHVHRVTASRWVLRAQEQLRERVFALLRARLGLSGEALKSVTRLVRSQLSMRLDTPP
jgi:RNA polymerase sigma-70 factor, ECF subfamily